MSKLVKKTAAKSSTKTAAKAAKTTAKAAAKKSAAKNARRPILDTFLIKVVKGAANPFTGEVQKKHAAAVLACNGKTVEDAKKKGADSWTIRELAKRNIIAVSKAA